MTQTQQEPDLQVAVPLTPREIEVIRLRDQEKLSWRQIAQQLGASGKGGVNSSYRAGKAKIERASNPEPPEPAKRETKSRGNSVEVLDPDATAEFLDEVTDPFQTIHAAALKTGFSPSTARRLVARLRTRHAPFSDALKSFKDKEAIALLEDRGRRALEHLDDFALAGSSARDLAVIAGIMVDKRQLLRGEPTQITKIEDIRKLDEVGKLLHAEMERRGLMIDVTPEQKPEDGLAPATSGKPVAA